MSASIHRLPVERAAAYAVELSAMDRAHHQLNRALVLIQFHRGGLDSALEQKADALDEIARIQREARP